MRLAFFRPRALPDDDGDNGGGRRKIPEITSSAQLFSDHMVSFAGRCFCKRTTGKWSNQRNRVTADDFAFIVEPIFYLVIIKHKEIININLSLLELCCLFIFIVTSKK